MLKLVSDRYDKVSNYYDKTLSSLYDNPIKLYSHPNPKYRKERKKYTKIFWSFLQNATIISRERGRRRFPFTFRNPKIEDLRYKAPRRDKKGKLIWTQNDEVCEILYYYFFLLFFSFFYYFDTEVLDEFNDINRVGLGLFLFNYPIFYYFFKKILYKLYNYNINIRYIVYSYSLDICYMKNYLFLFSCYIYLYVLNFYVMLNIGLIKYEHDKALTHPDKWDKIPKMDIDFFDYTEFSDFSISDDILLDYQDNNFFIFCAYEFHLDFNLYLCNIFSLSFFQKFKIKPKKNKEKDLKEIQKRKYLSNIGYSDVLEKKKSKFSENFPQDYDEFALVGSDIQLDYYNYIMDIRSFMVKIPYLFFLFHASYTINYRNFRYNLYIRGQRFFDEHLCKMRFFILHNNPYGKNKTKISFFKYQKLWTISYFKPYIETRVFNKWFLFYSTHSSNLKKIIKNEKIIDNYSFNVILNYLNLYLILKINKPINFEYIYEFYYNNMLDFVEINNSIEGYKLAMKTKSVKYFRNFTLGRSIFLELDEFIEMMYVLPYDIFFYYRHINKILYFDLVFDLYNDKFINYYFLKDFYNLNDTVDHIKSYKLANLYNQLSYLTLYVVDPFYLKFFWNKFFPERLKKLRRVFGYINLNMIQSGIRYSTSFDILNYDFFHHYFNWRADTSTSVQKNRFYKDEYSVSLSASNMTLKSRFLSLLNKLKFTLNSNSIFNIQRLNNFIVFLNDFFMSLFEENIDVILRFFFLDVNKLLVIQNNTNVWSSMNYIVDNNFLYRYYVCFFLFDFNYYIDWFNNRAKRVLWIFHKKDYKGHEGALFYRNKYNDMF